LKSFPSKFAHFFVDAERVPLYDHWAVEALRYHLGSKALPLEPPYWHFFDCVCALRGAMSFNCSMRQLDRYLWLSEQYRTWLDAEDKAKVPVSQEVRALFGNPSAKVQELLSVLVDP
jgi:hypothetical protein